MVESHESINEFLTSTLNCPHSLEDLYMATFDPNKKLSQLFTSAPFRIEGQWYHNQTFTLDGFEFVSCRFDSCNLHTSKGTFLINSCVFSNCTLYYWEEALKIVKLYGLLATDAAKRWPGLAPTQNPDGTISITRA